MIRIPARWLSANSSPIDQVEEMLEKQVVTKERREEEQYAAVNWQMPKIALLELIWLLYSNRTRHYWV